MRMSESTLGWWRRAVLALTPPPTLDYAAQLVVQLALINARDVREDDDLWRWLQTAIVDDGFFLRVEPVDVTRTFREITRAGPPLLVDVDELVACYAARLRVLDPIAAIGVAVTSHGRGIAHAYVVASEDPTLIDPRLSHVRCVQIDAGPHAGLYALDGAVNAGMREPPIGFYGSPETAVAWLPKGDGR